MAGDRGILKVHLITDGKAGHKHMAQAVAKRLNEAEEHIWNFPWWISLLRSFSPLIPRHQVDVLIFAGARTLPLALGYRNAPGVRVALSRPFGLPSSLFSLICLPRHDFRRPPKPPYFPLRIAPSLYTPSEVKSEAFFYQRKNSLPPDRPRLCILIGGHTKKFRFPDHPILQMLQKVIQWKKQSGYGILCTTSRRTPQEVEERIEKEFAREFEDWVPALRTGENPVSAYLGMSKKAIVTEDSFLMVSEALSAGVDLWILRLGMKRKMIRSYQLLSEEEGAFWAYPEEAETFLNRQAQPVPIDEASRISDEIHRLLESPPSNLRQ